MHKVDDLGHLLGTVLAVLSYFFSSHWENIVVSVVIAFATGMSGYFGTLFANWIVLNVRRQKRKR